MNRSGLLFAIAAYGWWGFAAIYFKAVRHVPPLELLAHRVVWSVVMLGMVVTIMRLWPSVLLALRTRRTLILLCGSTIVIAVNWFLFIWAVSHDRVLDASLGYFINPLVNVLLGFLVLHEALRRAEWLAVALAAAGVAWLAISLEATPWLALTLAFSFGLYGLMRKLAGVGALEGLTVETLLLLPIALSYLVYLHRRDTLVFTSHSLETDLLLLAAGPVTALPLIWFAAAVSRLRLATVGILQYISPTFQFLLAVLLWHEPFSRDHLIAFILIWTALFLYTFSRRPGKSGAPPVSVSRA